MAAEQQGNDGHDRHGRDEDTGRLIQNRYRLQELIGRGGMGEVWRALDESLGRKVAVKCLKPLSGSADPAFSRVLQERFRREARVAASLQHRGVTVVHDFGEHEGVLYLVMELLDGRNLMQVLQDARGLPLPVPDVMDIAEQVAAALAYTHAQGIVHRDLKPANIMRLSDGSVKICDFGIARLGHDIGFTSRLTGTGIAMGTPHYMSPEQIGADEEIDHRSDLYSLGCVLYELATSAPPFDLGDAWAVLVGHRDTAPRPPRGHRAELPEELDRLILDLLAKAPDDRPENAADVCGRLKAMSAAPAVLPVAVPAVGLPSWASDLAVRSGAQRVAGAPRGAGAPPELTGAWSTRAATPPPGLLGLLAGRHDAGIGLVRHGRWQEAEAVHRGVAAERERALGADHGDTLASRYELAYCLSRLGRADEALATYEFVAAARHRLLGPDHPGTLAARQEAAYVLGQLGRHVDAHQGYSAVLAARERLLGADHPDTLACRHNLAFNLGRLGRLDESYVMAAEVAAARERVLGPAHPDTLASRCEAGYLLGRLDRWAEALEAYRQVAAVRAAELGEDHPDTLAARYEAGIALGRLGRSPEAYDLYRELVAARTRTAGGADPETLRARHGLGVNLGRLGRWEEALTEARDIAAIRERVLGPGHPDTLVSKREIAVCLGWLGNWATALPVYADVADARERILGPAHPDALASRNDQAHCLEQLGRAAEALALYRQVAVHRRGSSLA
jgi:tRNA A-37 threonylcarbamoyl transferase component Bud32/tetratricopeptide (TPR) repeat protein